MFHMVLFLLSGLLAPAPDGQVYLVDDDGGPGVSFTSLPAAVAAADHGDVLLVAPGLYAATATDKGLRIQSTHGAEATLIVSVAVQDLPPDELLSLIDLEIGGISITDCEGTVVLEGLDASTSGFALLRPLFVQGSRDVRAYRSSFRRAMLHPTRLPTAEASNSRVEIVESTIAGQWGQSCDCGGCQDGMPALVVGSGAFVHAAALPLVSGGIGGDQDEDCLFCGWSTTGDGADAIRVLPQGALRLTGSAQHVVRGGDAGSNPYLYYYCDCTGRPASALSVSTQTSVVWSGVTFDPGVDVDCGNVAPPTFGPITELPSIPYLVMTRPGGPGGPIRFVLWGEPGAAAELVLGSKPLLDSTPGVDVELLVKAERRIPMGTISGGGNVSILVPARAHGLVPGLLFAQAELTTTAGLERTNSQLVVVR